MDHTFLIPIYGSAPYLESCIQSILDQSAHGTKILLGTSTPSDDIDRAAAKYGLSLRVNPLRRDIATDWNFLLEGAASTYVTLAHQDDLYDEHYLSAMVRAAEENLDLVMAFSDFREHTDAGARATNVNLRVKRMLCSRGFRGRHAIYTLAEKRRLLSLGNPICCPSVMLNLRNAPGFQFCTELKTNLDWDAWLRLAEIPGSFVYQRQVLVSKRVHAGSETTATIANRLRKQEDLQMFRRFWPSPIAAVIAAVYSAGYRANRVS